MRPIWLYAIGAALLVGLGFYASQERTARIEADKRVAVWKDSVQRATVRADAAEHLFDSTKAAYYALKPAVVQITKWKARLDTVLVGRVDTVGAGDSLAIVNVVAVKALFDSVTTDCARKDSLAREAIIAATLALQAKDSVIQIVAHPPQVPTKRIGFYTEAAYDFVAHGAVVNAGVYLKVGKVNPYAAIGAAIAKQATGTMQVGVRVSW